MDACLYDPDGGFFSVGPLRSVKDGDFLTSPEVSPWLGRTLARFVEAEQVRIGVSPFVVAEAGAGSGSLLKPLIETLRASSSPSENPSSPSQGPLLPPPQGEVLAAKPLTEGVKEDCSASFAFHAVETSAAARDVLTDLLGPGRVHKSFETLPKRFDGVIIANELLDNLPVALAVSSGDGWVERWIGVTEEHLGFVTVPARPVVVAWCDAYAGVVAEGGMVEVQLAASEWIGSAVSRINHGALLVIDYGGTAEELEPRRTQGTLRTYRNHHLGPDPLLEPGATDVTVDVNFTAMIASAEHAGASVEVHRQDDFLEALGLRDVVRELRHRERDLARSGGATERLVVRSEALDAETLLHPRGLGDFRAMIARSS